MAAVGEPTPKHVGLKIICDGIGNNHRTERQIAAGEALGASDDVRANAEMLRGEPFAGAAKSAHDLVVDQQDAVFVTERAQLGIIIVGRNKQAVGAGNSFDQNRRNGVRAFHLNDFFNMRNTFAMAGFHFLAKGTAITVRIKDANDSWHTGLDGPAARIARSGHRAHSCAVIGAITRDDFFAAGNELRDFHGVLVGFRAAQGEKGFCEAGDFGKFFA